MGSATKTGNPHIIGDGTPLPLEKLNWEVEDFNPEALMDSPCGMETEGPEAVGGGKMAVPQKQLVAVLKEKDEDFMTMDSCKKDMDKFVGPKGIFNTPPALVDSLTVDVSKSQEKISSGLTANHNL